MMSESYSATVSGYIRTSGRKIPLVKSNAIELVLKNGCDIAAGEEAELVISVDDATEVKRIRILSCRTIVQYERIH